MRAVPRWRLIGAGCALVVLLALITKVAWLSEDAYITFRTAHNVLQGYGLRWNVAERVQAYTHPLWLFCVLPVYAVLGHVGISALVVSAAATVSHVMLLARHIARGPVGLGVAVCVLASSRAFLEYSTSGLENPLTFLLIAIFYVGYAMRDVPEGEELEGWPIWALSLGTGLAMFNRMDTLLFFAPAMFEVLWRRRRMGSRAIVEAGSGALVVFGWMAFSVVYYGVPFPNTAYAKLGTGIERAEMVRQGIRYVQESLSVDPVTCIAIAGVLVLTAARGTRRERVLAAGIALYMLYVVRIGGDFMSGRFLSAPLFASACLLAHQIPRAAPRSTAWVGVGALVMSLFGTFPVVLSHPDYELHQEVVFGRDGIADERKFYYSGAGLSHMSWNLDDWPSFSWAMAGRALRARDEDLVIQHGNIGFRGYFAGPRVFFVDEFGLTDALIARLPAMYRKEWRIGHFDRKLPPGYVETLEAGGSNRITDPRIAELYNHMHRITREPLWGAERWRSIWMLNTGRLDHLVPDATYRFAGAARVSHERVRTPKEPGDPWDKDTVKFADRGVCVRLAQPARAASLTIAADANDTLVVFLAGGGRTLGRLQRDGTLRPGMAVDKLPVHTGEEPVDEVCVFPLFGDGKYSLGYLELEGAGVAN